MDEVEPAPVPLLSFLLINVWDRDLFYTSCTTLKNKAWMRASLTIVTCLAVLELEETRPLTFFSFIPECFLSKDKCDRNNGHVLQRESSVPRVSFYYLALINPTTAKPLHELSTRSVNPGRIKRGCLLHMTSKHAYGKHGQVYWQQSDTAEQTMDKHREVNKQL